MSAVRGPGRPRSSHADEAILTAALDLLAEEGFAGMSMEAVARKAGVGKDTLYRRWRSKTDLVRDAVDRLAEAVPWSSPQERDSARAELLELLHAFVKLMRTSKLRDLVPRLVAEGHRDAELAKALRADVARRRESVGEILRRGIARGELRGDIDVDLVIDFLLGAVQYRLLITGAPVTGRVVERAVDEVLRGAGAQT